MTGLNLHITNEDIFQWETYFGKSYDSWSEEEKISFLTSVASKNLSALDSCVNNLQLGGLAQTPFGKKVKELQEMGFRMIAINDFQYAGVTDLAGKQAKEVVLFHPSGLLYHATSTQEGLTLGSDTNIKSSALYFQASKLKEGASLEAYQLLAKGSGRNYADGTFFRSYGNIRNQEIQTLLEHCEFVEQWNSENYIALLNEADVYQRANGKVMSMSEEDVAAKQREKMDQFPEEVQQYLGYAHQKQR